MIMDPGEVPVRDGGGTQGRLHHRLKGECLNFLSECLTRFHAECEYFTGQFNKWTVAITWKI